MMTTDMLRWLANAMLDHRVTPAQAVAWIVTSTETGLLPEPTDAQTTRYRQADALRRAER